MYLYSHAHLIEIFILREPLLVRLHPRDDELFIPGEMLEPELANLGWNAWVEGAL